MKIAIVSDLHLEFGDWYPSNPEKADVLILSGDILVASEIQDTPPLIPGTTLLKSERLHKFLENTKVEYKDVIYVLGNHEHYHGDFAITEKRIRAICKLYGIHFLNRDTVKIDDVTFVGSTLWTNMNNGDSLTLFHLRGMMNDFRIIKNSNKDVSFKDTDGKFHTRPSTFLPEDAFEEHVKCVEYIRSVIEGKFDEKFVVVGHHAPSKLSTKPKYENDVIMNGGYSSDLSEFILDHPQIKLWTHGHTHHEFDYMIGETRIVCNPRGYVEYERLADHLQPFIAKVVEV